MKKIILILLSVLIASAMKGQISNRFTYITTIGTGIPMNEPSSTPFTWQVSGHYKLTERFSAGIGTGLSFMKSIDTGLCRYQVPAGGSATMGTLPAM